MLMTHCLSPAVTTSVSRGGQSAWASQPRQRQVAHALRFEGSPGSARKPHHQGRQIFYGLSAAMILGIGIAGLLFPPLWALYGVALPLVGLGIYDIIQPKHALRRNFPLLARFRWLAERIRPEIRQYFIESDTDGRPFSRQQRETVYKRSTLDNDTQPFGTQNNVYDVGVESMMHSIGALPPRQDEPRVKIGGPDCKQPYHASLFNISAMSYGSLSKNAVLALNKGAKMGGFLHNTGEGGISPYHLGLDMDIEDPKFNYRQLIESWHSTRKDEIKGGADLVWQLGTGYFGCRNPDGTFNEEKFVRKATLPNVKMIELKLSQGAKPGHGGILPASKLTPGIAKLRGVELGKDVISPPSHSAFSTPIEMLHFIKRLRNLSGGKPVGFKLCVGNKHEFLAICKAMLETGITPDFITIDGSEGGTGAAPREFSDSVGMPLDDGLLFVHNALVGTGLRDKMKLIASGKIINGFDIASKLARGADLTYSARGMMFSIGCIQALHCHTNKCPTGVATQDPELMKGLDPALKSVRTFNFHKETIKNFLELLAAAGLKDPWDIKPWHVQKRISKTETRNLSEIYEYLKPGVLLTDNIPQSFKKIWEVADPHRFAPKPSEKRIALPILP